MHPKQEYIFKAFISRVEEAEKAQQKFIQSTELGTTEEHLSFEFNFALIGLLQVSLALVQLLGQNLGDIDQNTLINLINKGEGATVQ